MPEEMLVLGEVQAGFLVEVDLQQSGCECPLRTYACPSAGGTLGAGSWAPVSTHPGPGMVGVGPSCMAELPALQGPSRHDPPIVRACPGPCPGHTCTCCSSCGRHQGMMGCSVPAQPAGHLP